MSEIKGRQSFNWPFFRNSDYAISNEIQRECEDIMHIYIKLYVKKKKNRIRLITTFQFIYS
jgi:hypothetical protein